MRKQTNLKNFKTSLKKDWSLKTAIDNCGVQHFKQTAVSSRYKESTFTFQQPDVLNGKIQTFITPEMEISHLNICSENNITILQNDEEERFVSTFIYKGSIHSDMKAVKTKVNQYTQQHSFIHSSIDECRHTIEAGETSVMYINLKPSYFESFFPEWMYRAKQAYKRNDDKKFFMSSPVNIQQNSRIQQIMFSIYNNTFNSVTRNLFIESKAMELMALQMDEVLMLNAVTTENDWLSKADKEKITALYEYININFLEPLSLTFLARKFTLNEFKLKKGFRQLYNQSVFNYILTLRMQRAKELLLDNITVTEVSDMIGYSSVNNFSNAFYKMYNYRPGRIKPAALFISSGFDQSAARGRDHVLDIQTQRAAG